MTEIDTRVRVLILEDDLDLALHWASMLQSYGYSCELAANPNEAKVLCQENEFQALIVDMFFRDSNGKLSGDGGLTFITHLRLPSLAETPAWGERVPILTVTGSEKIVDALGHARNAGADRTFRKPVDPEDLAFALGELIGRKSDHKAPVEARSEQWAQEAQEASAQPLAGFSDPDADTAS